jgi:hypothetical protein
MRRLAVLLSLIFLVQVAIDIAACASVGARELDFEVYSMIGSGMTEVDVLSRAGQPDSQMRIGKARNQFSWIWFGDPQKDEWTTTVTFSSVTKLVVEVSRTRH